MFCYLFVCICVHKQVSAFQCMSTWKPEEDVKSRMNYKLFVRCHMVAGLLTTEPSLRPPLRFNIKGGQVWFCGWFLFLFFIAAMALGQCAC